eukprot:1380450-Lingulodinium_polyedra.AAC.1
MIALAADLNDGLGVVRGDCRYSCLDPPALGERGHALELSSVGAARPLLEWLVVVNAFKPRSYVCVRA